MNHQRCLLLSLFFLFFVSALFAQIKEGFEYLGQKDYKNAWTAFYADLDQPLEGVAARYGLAECYLGENASIGALAKGLTYAREAEAGYSKLDSKDQRKLQKYGLSLNSLSRQQKDLQRAALDHVKESRSVLKLDTLIEKIRPLHPSIQTEFDKMKLELIQYAVRNAEDYPTISSLVKNYYVLIATTNYRYARELQERLLSSFIKDIGPQHLETFVGDHPDHSFSIDCWVHEFIIALNDPSPKALLRFLMLYPYSTLDGAASDILKSRTGNGFFIDVTTLNEKEKAKLEVLKEGWILEDQAKRNPQLPDEFQETLLGYLKKEAPASRTYDLMRKVLQKYLTNRQWEPANALITKSKPLYPDFQPDSCEARFYYYRNKQPWFKVAIPIVKREADGIVREAVEPVNTPDGDEFAPVVSTDGSALYFAATSRPENVGGEDIFVADFDFDTRTWSAPRLVEELSTSGDESPLSMTSDGNQLLLFKDGKLHISTLTPGGWSPPKRLPEQINSFEWIGRACLSKEGTVMIFAASEDPEEIYGESNIDLYFTRKDPQGNWSEPQSLGFDVNTFKEERSPFLYTDDETLYFSSNGHDGLGGMDVFFSKRLDDSWTHWSVPKNLGKEINSLEDDWGYNYSVSPVGNTVYISSDDFESGLGDIYNTGLPEFVENKKIVPVRIKIDNESDESIQTTVIVTDAETGEVIDEVQSRPDGSVTIVVPEDKVVNYYVKDEDLFPVSGTIDPAEWKKDPSTVDTVLTVPLDDMLHGGKSAPLNNILFDYDKDVLKPQSFPELLRVFNIVKNNTWRIEIEGHTDNEGTPEYNKDLSLRRAAAVKKYLQDKGIAARRMEVKGYGSERPVATNETDRGRAKNRRVEIRFGE